MPPPNITGKLHLGHALFISIQDSIIRWRKSKGYDTLWLPGTDHAGISMYNKIMQEANDSSISKEDFMARAWAWKDKYECIILDQIKALNPSANWENLRFTLDEEYQNSSIEALKRCKHLLYENNNQWYLDMREPAAELLAALEAGEINIIPKTEESQLLNFLRNIEPWCISRQIFWGQQMPIYKSESGNFIIANSLQEAGQSLSGKIEQINDCFDTWFNSSLWPFASLGWPCRTELYEKFYPAQLIETGDDILFFWCARMLMMGKLCTGIYPFKEIYLHGLIRDSKGIKMAKGLGNGIDPLDILADFGSDNLRWTLISNTTAAHDIKFNMQELYGTKKFLNKLWQAGRFFELNEPDGGYTSRPSDYLKDFTEQFDKSMQEYDFQRASRSLQHFFRSEFCDKWIEEHKEAIRGGDKETYFIGLHIYLELLKMFSIFIPNISEHLFSHFTNKNKERTM